MFGVAQPAFEARARHLERVAPGGYKVVAFVERNTGADCAIVVTYDSGLAYSLAQANLPRVLIVSPFRGPAFGGSRALPGGVCTRTRLYTVLS